MVLYELGDILRSVEKGMIVHGCNAQGKFASGVAGQVREEFPLAYETYRHNEKINKRKIQKRNKL